MEEETHTDYYQNVAASYNEISLRFKRSEWMGGVMASMLALFWSLILICRIAKLYDAVNFAKMILEWPIFRLSFYLGLEAGVLAIVALLLSLMPAMIMTWITALLFEFVCGRKMTRVDLLIEDGSRIAKDITFGTLKSVLKDGNLVAIGVMVACFLSAFLLKYIIT